MESGKLAAPMVYNSIGQMHEGMMKVSSNGQYGFCDATLALVVDTVYQAVYDFKEGLAAIEKDSLWGFVDKQGHEVVAPRYSMVKDFSNGLARVKAIGKYGVINKQGETKLPLIYDNIAYDDWNWNNGGNKYGLFIVTLGKKSAIVDSSNRERTPFRYEYIAAANAEYKVQDKGLTGFINIETGDTTALIYNETSSSKTGQWIVKKRDKWTILDSLYHQPLPDTFSTAEAAEEAYNMLLSKEAKKQPAPDYKGAYIHALDFCQGLAAVESPAHKWGFINKKGKEVIPCRFYDVGFFKHGRAHAVTDGKTGFINKKGKFILAYGDDTFIVHKDIIKVYKDRKCGVVTSKGRVIAPYVYDGVRWLSKGRLLVSKNDSIGCIDLQGNILLPLQNKVTFNNGLLVLRNSNTSSYEIRNKHLKLLHTLDSSIEVDLDNQCHSFHNGLLCVSDTTEKDGYINKNGKVKIPFVYGTADDFNNGRAVVHIAENINEHPTDDHSDYNPDTHGMINKRGKLIIPCIYKTVDLYCKRMPTKVKHEYYDKYGLVNGRGRLITPHMFSELETWRPAIAHGWKCVHRDNNWLYINKRGKVKLILKAQKSDKWWY